MCHPVAAGVGYFFFFFLIRHSRVFGLKGQPERRQKPLVALHDYDLQS